MSIRVNYGFRYIGTIIYRFNSRVGAFADITGHPNPGSPHYKSPVVNRALNAYLVIKQRRDAFKLGLLNLFLISVVLFDLSNKCPNQFSKWFYLEYVAAVVLSLSVLYYFGRYFYLKFSFGTIETTVEQKALMSSTDTGLLNSPKYNESIKS